MCGLRALRKAKIAICLFGATVPAVQGCLSSAADQTRERIWSSRGAERFNLILSEAERRIHPGLSDLEVISILGYPDGLSGPVWVWGCDSTPPCRRPMGDWYSVIKGQRDGMSLILYFDTDNATVPSTMHALSTRNADIWQEYQALTGLPPTEIDRLLQVTRPSDFVKTWFLPVARESVVMDYDGCCPEHEHGDLPIRIRSARGLARFDLLLSSAARCLEPGMSRAEVVRRVGYPDNMDAGVIWAWDCGVYPSCQRMGTDWYAVTYGRKAERWVYLLFTPEGRLLTSMQRGGAPWALYRERTGFTEDQVETLLGYPHPMSWQQNTVRVPTASHPEAE